MFSRWWIGASLLLWVSPASAATFLYFDSQPGDYIGGGVERTWTPSDGSFHIETNFDGGVSVSFDGGSNWWSLDFVPPEGGDQLGVGTYEGAERYPFQSPTAPGLSVSGSGRGCNELTGRFVVLELEQTPGGEVTSFAADFEQHCEGGPAALLGSIRFNAQNVPGILDEDGDGRIDVADNCPSVANEDQANRDEDEFGDVCDPFPDVADNLAACLAQDDVDGDGEADRTDACLETPKGDAVDAGGCSLAQFCEKFDLATVEGRLACRRADWRNDEPGNPRPRDCYFYKRAGAKLCIASPE